MRVKTRYFAFIREKIGRDSEIFDLDEGSTVHDFIGYIQARYREKLGDVFEADGLRAGFAIALNGENLDRSLWRQTRLKDGDVVVILPPIAGGVHSKLGSLTPLCP
ncbi:MAG: MoaD family protein [Candidatus Caldarchaeum sp.]|uniref:MoaD/ThiS family protein n=1 Tax=Caldiarchaeum subterraneum TaxID=311458 RepID=A0A7C5QD54_CALS0